MSLWRFGDIKSFAAILFVLWGTTTRATEVDLDCPATYAALKQMSVSSQVRKKNLVAAFKNTQDRPPREVNISLDPGLARPSPTVRKLRTQIALLKKGDTVVVDKARVAVSKTDQRTSEVFGAFASEVKDEGDNLIYTLPSRKITLGEFLGSGNTSHVYAHADDPSKAVRVSFVPRFHHGDGRIQRPYVPRGPGPTRSVPEIPYDHGTIQLASNRPQIQGVRVIKIFEARAEYSIVERINGTLTSEALINSVKTKMGTDFSWEYAGEELLKRGDPEGQLFMDLVEVLKKCGTIVDNRTTLMKERNLNTGQLLPDETRTVVISRERLLEERNLNTGQLLSDETRAAVNIRPRFLQERNLHTRQLLFDETNREWVLVDWEGGRL
jgi:hypothetical protein